MQLPKKHIIGNMKKDIVESRQIMLETFLDDVLTKQQIRESSELFIFLQPSDNYDELAGGKPTRVSKGSRIAAGKKRMTVLRKTSTSAPTTPGTEKLRSSSSISNRLRATSYLENVAFRKSDPLAVASTLEDQHLPLNTKPLFVKKSNNPSLQSTRNYHSTSDLKSFHPLSPRTPGNEFIPVLPPVPKEIHLRSSASPSSNSKDKNNDNNLRNKFQPRTPSNPNSPRSPRPRHPLLPPKPSAEELERESKPLIPPKPKKEEFKEIDSSRSKRTTRSVTVAVTKMRKSHSVKAFPPPPNKP